MKKTPLIIGAVVAAAVLFVCSSTYNGVIPLDESTSRTTAEVQTMLGRQAELLPNLAATVKGSSDFEKDTFTQVSEARSAVGAVAKLNPRDIANDPKLQAQVVDAQAKMQAASVRVQATAEKYPELKSTGLYQTFMAQIEGAQNRVVYARHHEQDAFVKYNEYVRPVPRGWLLALMGFHVKPYYDAGAAAQHAPTVKF